MRCRQMGGDLAKQQPSTGDQNRKETRVKDNMESNSYSALMDPDQGRLERGQLSKVAIKIQWHTGLFCFGQREMRLLLLLSLIFLPKNGCPDESAGRVDAGKNHQKNGLPVLPQPPP
jgi:hypothetical protein